MPRIVINGKEAEVPEGLTILEAARKMKIYIPTLCHHPKLTPFGGCRLCIVEVKGSRRPMASCTTPVSDRMEITTSTPEIEELRRNILDLILSDHPQECLVCEGAGSCQLQELAYAYNLRDIRFTGERRHYNTRDGNPFIERDLEKCVLCGRCVKVCDEVQGVKAIDFANRGFYAKISTAFEKDLDCEFCGQCISVCPTGALTGKQWKAKGRQKDISVVNTTCSYCGTGCTLTLHVKDNEIVRVTSPQNAPNEGLLCVKGRFGYTFVSSPDRLKRPLIRTAPKDSVAEDPFTLFREASWDEAIDMVASKLRAIKTEHGPDAIGGLASARCTNEENYLFQKFIRAAIGTNNVDHCARLCHAPTVASLATVFGSGAMTNSVQEIEGMEVIFIIGSNTKETHPVVANRMIMAHRKGAKIIVADPRKVPMVRFSEVYLPMHPGTDIALLNGLANVIINEGLWNKDFVNSSTEGFEEWKDTVREYTPERVAEITGVSKDLIIKAARLYGASRKAGIFYTMGVTQHACGSDNVKAIANLALLTGNIGRPYTGVNPLRGQNNVQGASDAGCVPNVYPGYQKVDSPEVREKFQRAWGVELSPTPGLKSTEMIPAILDGKIRAIYVMGENPVLAEPNANHTIKSLQHLDFLVVQDIFMSETARLADVVLPAACFAEKDGTFTNTDRRVQRVRKAVEPPGEARPDIQIIMEISKRLGYDMKYNSPAEVLREFGSLWPALAGITYERLEKGGIQWPCPDTGHPGTPYLYANGFPAGKPKFSKVFHIPPAEIYDEEYPFVLTTGRNLYQYHYGTMSRRVKEIEAHAGEAYVEINPSDAEAKGITDNDRIRLVSRRGDLSIKARITNRVRPGTIFVPIHYHEAAANRLTNDALDPVVKIPEYKVCAVRVER